MMNDRLYQGDFSAVDASWIPAFAGMTRVGLGPTSSSRNIREGPSFSCQWKRGSDVYSRGEMKAAVVNLPHPNSFPAGEGADSVGIGAPA